ncbi:MAG: beta-ribofuranosylaminobenzene 5'-phosphate synthase family protein [Rhizobiaceae bacterium]
MSSSVVIRLPARLHLGFLDPSGSDARRFGSIGLPLSEPETVITLRRAPETVVEGPEAERAARHLATMKETLGLRGHHRLTIEHAIPAHAGLGSGTQIALAVAAALRTLHGRSLDIGNDAMRLSRGRRSGIGIASFDSGGIIIDAGQDGSGAPPPVVARMPFPDEWRVILVLDQTTEGLHGEDEMAAFRKLPPFPRTSVGEICRLALMGVMPALVSRDFASFGAAIASIQRLVGEHFAPAQGGVFTSRRVADVIAQLAAAGAAGIGQSSWGPTGFAFAPSEQAAQKFVASVAPNGTELHIVRGRNDGAAIAVTGLDLVAN